MPEPSTFYEEKRTLIEKLEALETENKALRSEKVKLEKALIRIQNYLNDFFLDAPFGLVKAVRDNIIDLILQADSENDTPGPSTQAIADSQTGLHPSTND